MKILHSLAVFFMIISLANADEHDRIHHYKGHNVSTISQAILLLQNETSKIATILDKKNLSGQDLESIHEISYSLENAVNFLNEKKMSENIIDPLDEAIQAIHYASENHDYA